MKIIIKEKEWDKKITFRVPLWVVINSVTSAMVSKKLNLSYSQAQEIMAALKKSAKLLKGKPFIEATEKGGDKIVIFL